MELTIEPVAELAPAVLNPETQPPETLAERTHIPLIFGTFFLSGDEFAVEMSDLQEIAPPPTNLQKMPLSAEFVCGLFNLRGRIVPVVDLRLILQMQPIPGRQGDIPCMVVVSQGPAAIGILFDAVGEILRLHANDVVPVTARCPDTEVRPSPVKAILTRNGGERVIQILDLSLLLSIRNLPLLERRSKQRLADKDFLTRRMRDLKREKMIGFNIGDFDLAFEMKCVLAILDNKGTRPSPRKSELCESVILFGKKVVPVVPLAHVLSIPRDAVSKRIIVCQVGESFIGFEVSEVTTIMPFSPERVLPIPVLSEHRSSVIKGCFKREDGTDFIVLNHEATLSNPEIVDISVGHQQIGNERQLSEETSGGPRVSLLTFRLGKLFGIRLLDVTEVLIAPKTLVRTPSMPPAVLGVLNLRGEPVSVIDPRQLLQLDPAPAETLASVLVFRHERRKVAMLVDSIESIVSVPAGPELELPEIFFREEQAKLMDSFERGLHVETDGVKSVLLLLSAEQIVKLLIAALML